MKILQEIPFQNCITSLRVMSFHFTKWNPCSFSLFLPYSSCLILLYSGLFRLTLLYSALPCLTLPCPTLPYPALPCSTLPYPALPCPTLPCPALPCPDLPYPSAWTKIKSNRNFRCYAQKIQWDFFLLCSWDFFPSFKKKEKKRNGRERKNLFFKTLNWSNLHREKQTHWSNDRNRIIDSWIHPAVLSTSHLPFHQSATRQTSP